MLLVSICSPYLFTFCDSIFKCMFGNKPWPSIKIIILVLIIETAHSFGVSIFVFRVLPKLDLARAILMMNAVCIVPGLLKLFLAKTNVSTMKRLVIFVLDFVAICMQCTVFGIVFLSKYLFKATGGPGGTGLGGMIDDSGVIETTTESSIWDELRAKRGLENETVSQQVYHTRNLLSTNFQDFQQAKVFILSLNFISGIKLIFSYIY